MMSKIKFYLNLLLCSGTCKSIRMNACCRKIANVINQWEEEMLLNLLKKVLELFSIPYFNNFSEVETNKYCSYF